MTENEAGQCFSHVRTRLKFNQIKMAERMQLGQRQLQRLEAGTSPILPTHLDRLAEVITAEGWAFPRSLGPLREFLGRLIDPRGRMSGDGWRSKFRLFRVHQLREEVTGAMTSPHDRCRAAGLDDRDYAERTLLRKMAAHGGEFARALAAAWLLADPHNAACLRASFGGMLARYEGAPAVAP